ncbi:hypothetical protein TcBrA4_0088250 [Trypanosoma cruzi]|nr:hypothetical protein TcBrA4_0088250 [Trypanosoma cruzi]
MDRVSILHAFPSESTFLADVPSSILRRPVERARRHGSREIGSHDTHEAFMRALSGSIHTSQSCIQDGGEEKVLSVMRVVSINGSVDFHERFLAECESYCRLCSRLQHAVDWLLLRKSRCKDSGTPTGMASHASDVDSLSHVVYPLEPTAFLAAAFALPSLASISSSLPGDEGLLAATAADGKRGGSPSLQSSRTVPYCFFHWCPMQRLLRIGGDSGGNNRLGSHGSSSTSSSGGTVFPGALRRTLMERVTAIANIAGVCGCVSPVHNALSVHNRCKIGLTLSAYMDDNLPRSVTTDGGGASTKMTTYEADPFSRWRDDILWRLLGSLVSALAVLHASGFHYRGGLSADDILCFALPNDDDDAFIGDTMWQEGERDSNSIGQRLNGWVKGNQRRWLITEATPAHQAFFMFATLPRSLFVEESKDPSELAAAQRRDTAAVGRIILMAVEEMKRRRGAKGMNSCSELIFVAERMATMEEAGGRMLAAEAPAHRFAQLQAVQLRTHLWFLRAIVDERDAELEAAAKAAAFQNNSSSKATESKDRCFSSRLLMNNEAFMEKLNERERLLSEREKNLERFLVLYELTAERLDELPAKKDGLDLLKRSLLHVPGARSPAIPGTTSTPLSATASTWSSGAKQPRSKPVRCPATTAKSEAAPSDRTQPLYGLLRFSKSETAGSASAPGATATLSSRSVTVLADKGKQSPGPRTQQWTSQVTSERSSRRGVVLPSSPSLLHLNWKRVSSILAREGANTAVATARSSACRRKSILAGTVGRALTPRTEVSSAPATTAGGEKVPAARERSSKRPMSVKRGSFSTAPTQVQSRKMTPSRGQRQASILLSPEISPLGRVKEENSSLLLASCYKTPPRATSSSTPMPSRGSPATTNAWNKMSTPHSTNSTTQGATPRHLQSSVTSIIAKELKMSPDSALSLSPVTGHLLGTTPKEKSPFYNPLLYMAPPEGAMNLSMSPDKSLSAKQPAKSPTSAKKEPRAPVFGAHSPLLQRDGSTRAIRMHNGRTEPNSLEASRETPNRRQRGDGASAKTGTPNNRLLNGAHRPGSDDGVPSPRFFIRFSEHVNEKEPDIPQSSKVGRPRSRCRQEQEEKTTPRALRSRIANDGWVNHHLQVLEKLRYDFQQSEMLKSARSTPSGKALGRGVRGPNAAGVGAFAPPADRGKNRDASTWGDGSSQAAAGAAAPQATSEGAKLMY